MEPPLQAEDEYWEMRYRKGGNSGAGSVGSIREWKWRVIEQYAGEIDDVIDVGCGDLSFWKGRDCAKYFGLDASPTVIERDKRERPSWEFRVHRAEIPLEGIRARVVLCSDVLFHIMNDDDYKHILENICQYSREWLFVHTWSRNPFNLRWMLQSFRSQKKLHLMWMLTGSDGEYQKFRHFENYLNIFDRAGFALIGKEGKGVGTMYVFRQRPSAHNGGQRL